MTDDERAAHVRFNEDETNRIMNVHEWWCVVCDEHGVEHPPHPFHSVLYAAEWAVHCSLRGEAMRELQAHKQAGGRVQ